MSNEFELILTSKSNPDWVKKIKCSKIYTYNKNKYIALKCEISKLSDDEGEEVNKFITSKTKENSPIPSKLSDDEGEEVNKFITSKTKENSPVPSKSTSKPKKNPSVPSKSIPKPKKNPSLPPKENPPVPPIPMLQEVASVPSTVALSINTTNLYDFIALTELKVKGYIIKNKNRINELMKGCFSASFDLLDTIFYRWFIVENKTDHRLIGFCICLSTDVSECKSKITPYTAVKYICSHKSVKIYPYLANLCKDKDYPEVGKFLLNNVCVWFKKNENKDKLYLAPGSSRISCSINSEYYKSNMKLVDYYKTNQFRIVPNLYIIYPCGWNKYIHAYLMVRDII